MAAKSTASKADDGRNESGQDASSARMSMDDSDEDARNKSNGTGSSDDGVVAEDNPTGNAITKAHGKAKNAWEGGSPKPRVARSRAYEKPVAVFMDIYSPTREELNNFYV